MYPEPIIPSEDYAKGLEKLQILEGISCIGKTSYMDKAKEEGYAAMTLDYFSFLDTTFGKAHKWHHKSHDSILASAYGGTLQLKMVSFVMQNRDAKGIKIDRGLLSDFVYNLLFGDDLDWMFNTPQGILREFQRLWYEQRMTSVVMGACGHELDKYFICVDSDYETVTRRMRDRNTTLDNYFLNTYPNYVEVQTLVWTYVATELGIQWCDLKGQFISDVL